MSVTTSPTHGYDPFTGPELDPQLWNYLEYPLPGNTRWVCTEASARLSAGEGRFTVEIDRFEREHPVQIIDNCKFVVLSTQAFEVPATGTVTVTGELAATSINASGDYRDGFASLIVIEPSTGLVYDIAATSAEVFAIHERLPISDSVPCFTRIVDDPLARLQTGAAVPHNCTITLDAAARTVKWLVDDTLIFDAKDIDIPQQFHVGLGIFTLHPVGPDASTSIRGQGVHASWSNVAVEVQP